MEEKIKRTKLEIAVDTAVLLGSAAGGFFIADSINDSKGLAMGLTGAIYSAYHETKKLFVPKYGKPSFTQWVCRTAPYCAVGIAIESLNSKF